MMKKMNFNIQTPETLVAVHTHKYPLKEEKNIKI